MAIAIILKSGANIFKQKAWLFLFVFCFIYWAYLIAHTTMPIVFDSIDYENTGKIIYQQGGWSSTPLNMFGNVCRLILPTRDYGVIFLLIIIFDYLWKQYEI